MESMKKKKRSLVLLPNEILSQIFLQLPIKILSKFKCVSKEWIYLMEDLEFVDSHRIRSLIRSRHVRILELHTEREYKNKDDEDEDTSRDDKDNDTNKDDKDNDTNKNNKYEDTGRDDKNNDTNKDDKYDEDEEGPEPSIIFIQDPEEEYSEAEKISLQISSLFALRVFNYYPGEAPGAVEGLICFDNLVMNPSTKEVIELPKLKGNWESFDGTCSYYLGFDTHSKTYKVLAFPRIDNEKDPNDKDYWWNDSSKEWGSRVLLHGGVITLGATNSWRSVIFPKNLVENPSKSLIIHAHLSFDNKIFILVSPNHFDDVRRKRSLLIFGIKEENFIEVIKELPWDLYDVDPFEVNGRLAIMECRVQNKQRVLWILDDFDLNENAKWIKRTILIFKEEFFYGIPICTIGNDDAIEILFKTFKWTGSDRDFYFYYNMKTNNIRVTNGSTYGNDQNRLLTKSPLPICWSSKYIETMFKLKLRL